MSETGRTRYPVELKEAVIKRMMPPSNEPICKLIRETEITEPTLYA